MAHFVLLAQYTDQGIRNVKDTVKRAEAFKEVAKSAGVTVKDIYWTLGRYDIVMVAEAKDDTAMTSLGLMLAKAGNVRTETLRGYQAADMSAILGRVN